MTDYTDPQTIDVDEVITNVNSQYQLFHDHWDDTLLWPDVTVKALADEILRLRNEHEIRVDLIRDRWLDDPQNGGLLAALFEVVTGTGVVVEVDSE